MLLPEIIDLFEERPLKITSVHRGVIARMIAVCRAAQEWAEDTQDLDLQDNLQECINDLLDYDD